MSTIFALDLEEENLLPLKIYQDIVDRKRLLIKFVNEIFTNKDIKERVAFVFGFKTHQHNLTQWKLINLVESSTFFSIEESLKFIAPILLKSIAHLFGITVKKDTDLIYQIKKTLTTKCLFE